MPNSFRMAWLMAAGVVLAASSPADAQDFYAGKQVTFIAGSAVGGTYDLMTRLTARHLGRLLPGNPNVIVQNMPAASSLAASNYLYNQAPKDGTVIALIQRGMLLAKLTNPASVKFELDRLNWLGNLNAEVGLVLAWHTAPHRSAKDLFEQELIVGGQTGVDPELTPRLYNSTLGTRFKIVTGYTGTVDIALAMERGEVQGIGDWSYASLKTLRPDWIPQKRVTLLMQGGLQKHSELPHLPSVLEFVKNDLNRRVLELYFTQKTIARPVIAPPGVPAPQLAMLRKAFAALATDKQFLADAAKSKLEVEPSAGEAVDKVIALITKAPPDVATAFAKAVSSR